MKISIFHRRIISIDAAFTPLNLSNEYDPSKKNYKHTKSKRRWNEKSMHGK